MTWWDPDTWECIKRWDSEENRMYWRRHDDALLGLVFWGFILFPLIVVLLWYITGGE